MYDDKTLQFRRQSIFINGEKRRRRSLMSITSISSSKLPFSGGKINCHCKLIFGPNYNSFPTWKQTLKKNMKKIWSALPTNTMTLVSVTLVNLTLKSCDKRLSVYLSIKKLWKTTFSVKKKFRLSSIFRVICSFLVSYRHQF